MLLENNGVGGRAIYEGIGYLTVCFLPSVGLLAAHVSCIVSVVVEQVAFGEGRAWAEAQVRCRWFV